MQKTKTEITLRSLNDIDRVAKKILDHTHPCKVFTLSGDLGAGKTTLTQAICRRLGIQEQVTSPTYSLVNEYIFQTKKGEQKMLRHLDLYRLKNLEEALDIGIEDFLEDGNYCFIEWPEIIEPLLSEKAVNINISILEDSSRKILIL